jgi:hypothetical protein
MVPPRSPAVSGIFYPERKEPLGELLERLVPFVKEKRKAIAAIVPHGSLFSSGAVAGAVYGGLEPFDTAVILGPNHSRLGERLSVAVDGEWATPLGQVSVDRELARLLLKAVPDLKKDPKAHQHEHAAELQLPFLQRFWKIRSFVPLAFLGMDAETARQAGLGVARALQKSGREALLIATAHLTRYEPRERAERLDRQLIERITALDGEGLMRQVAESGGSMCGAPAVAAAIAAAKELGASRASLVKYEVGYGGFLIE